MHSGIHYLFNLIKHSMDQNLAESSSTIMGTGSSSVTPK